MISFLVHPEVRTVKTSCYKLNKKGPIFEEHVYEKHES